MCAEVTSPAIDAFWRRYVATLPPDAPRPAGYTAWAFGDSPALADELGALVYAGTKTATCGSLWEYEADGEPVPAPGDLSVILTGEGVPLCIIETTEVTVQPFNTVDARFAYDEGEDDRSYEYWHDVHLRFFTRSCARIRRELDESMPVVAERFRVVYRE